MWHWKCAWDAGRAAGKQELPWVPADLERTALTSNKDYCHTS